MIPLVLAVVMGVILLMMFRFLFYTHGLYMAMV